MSDKREFQLICYGVTGFTGQLCAQYLNSVPEIKGKWAAAGRNKEKIEARLKEVGVEGVPIVIADSSDPASLDKMCKRTKVVCSLVGPYVKYGTPLVKACVENGNCYVDLNGEAPWCFNMMKQFGDQALQNKATLVFSTGYDSVPSELTTFLAVQKLKGLGKNVEVGEAMGAASGKGTLSGGTFATLLEFAKAPTKDKKVAANPYALSPVDGGHKHAPFLFTSTVFKGRRQWGGFWLMAPHNTAIVRRSWGVFEQGGPNTSVFKYGPKFKYDEMMAVPNPIAAAFVSIALFIGFSLLTLVPPVRWLAEKYGPQAGVDGPSKELQENGWFKQVAVVKSVDKTKAVQVTMKGKGDPGYAATSKMIAECALAFVLDADRLPPLAKQGGFLTPATAFGPVLVERLEKTGYFSFTSEVEETDKTK